MKRMWIGALALSMAMTIVGCGSEKGGAATVTKDAGATTDTATAADTATAGGDAGTADTGTTTKTDAGTTDAGTTDAGTGDTGGTTGNTKCANNDNACLQACSNKVCTNELAGCNQDKGCSSLITCLNGCAQNIPAPKPATSVTMPNGSTPTTCQDFCIVNAGDAAYKKLGTMQICIQGKCIKDIPGETSNCVQGTAKFSSCINTCVAVKCGTQMTTCNNSKDCTGLLTCLNGCKSGDQTCQQECQSKTTAIGLQEYQAVMVCLQSKCIKQP